MGRGSIAHAEDLPTGQDTFELTPRILEQLVECRAPREVLGEVGMALFMGERCRRDSSLSMMTATTE